MHQTCLNNSTTDDEAVSRDQKEKRFNLVNHEMRRHHRCDWSSPSQDQKEKKSALTNHIDDAHFMVD